MKQFATNQVLREEVREYIIAQYKKEAVEMVFNRANTLYIADAVDLLNKAFDQMEIDYGINKTNQPINNQR